MSVFFSPNEMMEEISFNTKKPEYIICSAIHFNDGKKHEHQPKNITNGFVVCGRRHHNCYITTWILNGEKSMSEKMTEANGRAIQGFLTSKDRFVDRKEGGKIAYEQKQIDRETDCMFSEDLY